MTPPSVSIMVMNHNYGRYVAQALASAVGQDAGVYRLAEVAVVDDGSTDDSAEVYRRFPDVRVIDKPHGGFGSTLTRAVGEACGNWVALLDADDCFAGDKLRVLAPNLGDPALLVIQHAEYVIDAEGRPFAEGTHPGGSTSTLVVRSGPARDLLPVTNELFFRVLADLGHGVRLPVPLTRYRVHDASMTDRTTPGVFSDYMAGVCDDIATRLDEMRAKPPWWADAGQLETCAAEYRDRADRFRASAQRQREHNMRWLPEETRSR